MLRTLRSYSFKSLLAVLAGIILLVASLIIYSIHASNAVRQAYENYTALAAQHVNAAYVPGAGENAERQRLNSVLSQVLVRPMSASERIALAQEGLTVLKAIEAQIDEIGATGDKVQASISHIQDKAASPGAIFVRGKSGAIIDIAKEEFEIIADIRGLSYRANFHTAEIFNRILLDQGQLTAAYSRDLNDSIPAVEEQFNKRAGLYKQLEEIQTRMQQASAAI